MRLYLSNTFYHAYEGVVRELVERRKCDNDKLGLRHIIIVPDEFTMSVEKGILTSLKIYGAFDVEVTSFRRLANRFLSAEEKNCLTPEGSVMLLSKVILSNIDSLKYYKNSARSVAFAQNMYATLTALRNDGMTSADIRRSAEPASDATKNKLLDIALLFEKYSIELQNEHRDSGTKLQALARRFEEFDCLEYHFYVCDFYEFSAPQYLILSALMKKAYSLTVSLVANFLGENRRYYPNRTVEKMRQLAIINNVEIDEVRGFARLEGAKFSLAHNLYSFENVEKLDCGDSIELCKCPTVEKEIEYVGKQIRRLVCENRCRFKDIAVVVGNITEYAPIFKRVFKRLEIPYFIDQKELLSDQVPVRLLLDTFAVLSGGYERADVFELMKNPLFTSNLSDFENYVLKYNVDRSRFCNPFMLGEDSERCGPEAMRKKMVYALEAFGNVDEEITGCRFIELIRDYKNRINYDSNLTDYLPLVESDSRFYADCLRQVDGKILLLFDEVERIFSDVTMPCRDYFAILSSALTSHSSKISLIPMYVDSVFVGEMGESRYADVKNMFLVGTAEGVVPRECSEDGILGEKEELLFEQSGKPLSLTGVNQVRNNIFFLIQLLLKPTDRLYVSYSETSRSGDSQRPSTLFSELSSLFVSNGNELKLKHVSDPKPSVDVECDAADFAFHFATEDNMFFQVLSAFRSDSLDTPHRVALSLLSPPKRALIDSELLSPPKVPMKFAKGRSSISQFISYFDCPYKHFAAYGLGLSKPDVAELDALTIGTIIHGFLEEYFKLFLDGIIRFDMPAKHLADVSAKLFDKLINRDYPQLLLEENTAFAVKRIAKECVETAVRLSALQANSKFSPIKLEAVIGSSDIPPFEVNYSGGKLSFSGKIDRIDSCGNNIIVIDYKSSRGSAEFSARDFYFGKKIQLHLYAAALLQAAKVRLCGVFYLPVDLKYTKDEKLPFRYSGQVINDPHVMRDIDSVYDTPSSRLPSSVSGGKIKNAISEMDLQDALSYVVKLLANAADEIAEGNIVPSPLGGACDYCDFESFCPRKDKCSRKKTAIGTQIVFRNPEVDNG